MESMTKEELFQVLQSLRKANLQGGARAPYKPLLILWMLGQLKTTGKSEFAYEQLEQPVTQLIDEFSQVSRTKYRAYLPFFHLEDELWVLNGKELLQPKRAPLLRANAVGHLQPKLVSLLQSEPGLIEEVARFIIGTHFTESYLSPIFAAVGLDEEAQALPGLVISIDHKKRDPNFRPSILKAWRMRCAMCGFDGQVGAMTVGLEAAHVKWFSQGGPDEVANGLALCEIHHSLFDLGVLGLSQGLKIQVSQEFVGKSAMADRLVYDLHETELFEPLPSAPSLSRDFVQWHTDEVFKGAIAS